MREKAMVNGSSRESSLPVRSEWKQRLLEQWRGVEELSIRGE